LPSYIHSAALEPHLLLAYLPFLFLYFGEYKMAVISTKVRNNAFVLFYINCEKIYDFLIFAIATE
jgi:hypothetical protein